MRISDWSSDVCSSDLIHRAFVGWSDTGPADKRLRKRDRIDCRGHSVGVASRTPIAKPEKALGSKLNYYEVVMEMKKGAGREGVQPATGSSWLSTDRAGALFHPTRRAGFSGRSASSQHSTGPPGPLFAQIGRAHV